VKRSTPARGTVLVLLLSAIFCQPVQAESIPLSIHEITSLALKQSAELAALEKDAAAQLSLAHQAGTISNPTLDLQGSTGSLTGSPDERSASIGINQELPLNGKRRLRHEVAEREAKALQLQHDNAARLLRDEVATLALDYSLTSKRQELAVKLVTLNRDLVAIAGERFKAGDIPELDFNLAKVELARAESRLLEVERESTPLLIKISSLTGLKEPEIRLSDVRPPPAPSKSSPELLKQALASRPDLLAQASEMDKAGTGILLAEAEALPNLTAGLFVQWQRSLTEVGGMSSTSSDTQLGLRLSMPIPLFDRNQGGRAAARARQEAAASRRLALERSIAAEVEAAAARLTSTEQILALYEQGIIPQLAENLNLTQEAYRLGEVGIISVIDEQRKFFEVNDGYLSALHGRQLASIKLETAVAAELSGGVK